MATSPFVQTLTEFREELAVSVITNVCVDPVDREVSHQRKAARFSKVDCFDDVSGLRLSGGAAAA